MVELVLNKQVYTIRFYKIIHMCMQNISIININFTSNLLDEVKKYLRQKSKNISVFIYKLIFHNISNIENYEIFFDKLYKRIGN